MHRNPKKVTENDMKELYTKLKHLMEIINRGRTYDNHKILFEISPTSHKPRIKAEIIKGWSGINKNLPDYDTIRYVHGDTDGTWERLIEWIPKLELKAAKTIEAKERTKTIANRIGKEDLLFFIQVSVGAKYIDESGNIL